MRLAGALCCLLLERSGAFRFPVQSTRVGKACVRAAKLVAGTDEDAELFANPGWADVAEKLNALPAFAVADKDGNVLRDTELVGRAVFYLDAAAAEAALTRTVNGGAFTGGELGVVPFGLANAWREMREGAAILVADTAALAAAGAPDGADGRAGEDVPLFGCPELAREGAGGTPTLPLFLDRADLQAALDMAAPGNAHEVLCLGLGRAIELLVTVPEKSGFEFSAASSSLTYIQSYLNGETAASNAFN